MAVQTEGNVKKRITSSHDIMKEQFTSGHDEDHSVLLLMIMWLHYVQHETKCYREVASQLSVIPEPTVSKPHQFHAEFDSAFAAVIWQTVFSWTELNLQVILKSIWKYKYYWFLIFLSI